MKRFFLIPLMTLMCSVMAFATDVATKDQLQAALNAGGDIRLTSTINLGSSQVTMTSGTATLDLNGNNLNSTKTGYNANAGALNVSGGNLTINATGGGEIKNTGGSSCGIVVKNGASVVINGGSYYGKYEGIYLDGGTITINGGTFPETGDNNIWLVQNEDIHSRVIINGGTFNGADGWCCFQVDAYGELEINGGTFNAKTRLFWDAGTIVVKGGAFNQDPALYVAFDEALMSEEDGIYTVSKSISGAAYCLNTYSVYNSLQDAVDEASAGSHIMVLAANQSATVGKSLTFELGEYSANITATSGFQKSVNGDFVSIMAEGSLGAYLNGDSEDPFVVSANVNLADQGLVKIKGNKKITINEGVTLSCAFLEKYSNFRVSNGAKLTVEGNGTIASDRGLFTVEKGGELVIGKADKSDKLTMTTTVFGPVNNIVVNYGKTTINNAEMHAASAVAQNWGVMEILKGTYTAEARVPYHKYAITSDNESQMTIKNSTIKGIHGALAVQGINGSKKGGSLRLDNCELIATDNPNGTQYSGASVSYALYSATGGIASVYNTKMKAKGDKAIHIGNNDAYNTFGLVYIYEGCMVKSSSASNRIYVQQRKATDREVLFPVSVDQNSKWYTVAVTGGDGPLPEGYKWKAIISSGDEDDDHVVDATAFAAGYRWLSVSTAAKQEDASGTTIPWQQNTTWTDTETPSVPDEYTAVIIPEGKTVVVSKDETNKNAKAEQIVLEGEGASLTVQEGTTLNVENGVNIADGGNLVVNAGAMVTIGAGGLVTASDDAVKIEMTEGQSGIFMIAPSVTENTHPMAKVELVSKACYVPAEDRYIWQRFGVPSYMEGMTKANVEYDHVAYPTAWMKIEHQNWADFEDGDVFKPFTCYGLTTNATTAGAVYTFSCPLMGNGNAELDLTDNWNYYANSYTAPISIRQMLADFKENNPNVSGTVYLYRAYDNWWYEINNAAYAFGVDENDQPLPEQIAPMQAFIFQRRGEGENPEINYLSQIWNPIMIPSNAPARARESFNKAMIEIVAEDGTKDAIRLIEGSQFSADFDNSYDAAKYMKDNSFNLFADANDEKLGTIASDNLEGTTISMNTKSQTSFTMTIKHANGMNYAIRDMLTGTEVEMAEGATYMFSVPADANVEGRFQIVSVAKMPTAIDNIETTAAIKGIYTVNGQYVGNNYHILPKGVYVVDGKKIVK